MKYKIVGEPLPTVLCDLEPGEVMISENGGRSWVKGDITTETKGGGAGKMFGRMMSGESLFLSHYTAVTHAQIAFSSSFPGSIRAVELASGQSIICQKTAFLAATEGVELSTFIQRKLGAGFFGGEGFIMQKVTGPGTAFIELDGYSVEYDLADGEKLVCDTGVVSMMDETCKLEIEKVKGLKNKVLGGEGFFDTVVYGPGKVTVQTMTAGGLAATLIPFLPQGK
ncbi:uncharacterized protein (TIGR00266 family) [Breznakia sp. PF5-3]|uniref:AIM24 family protein n=1 Tax=unclassified Breznakia TaxID=2623764 RepID=UPI0024068989|nr:MULTISPECIES: AIM24 family protein [unclassified Breznakia]MDF9824933.1 uncharacterized protein (TIGR00266 family) [Breznakia sp. PM6-1]MDF9835799.1 uncharacterized protein (TIGR00266 family) [Breznakia sp. PF5-3]MDF9837907.1 uncharacterized protein (TIGR00266 family) [Breznakia sp. PFB2-8]MDF9859896.1 uncharacterized protein (TIGR00266 family) [Breznakia sp. PH5-24]